MRLALAKEMLQVYYAISVLPKSRLTKETKNIRFDIVVSFDAKDRRAVYNEVIASVQEAFPDYQLQCAMDTDFAEE